MAKKTLRDKLTEELLGGSGKGSDAPADAASAAGTPQKKQDKVRDVLKGLFR